MDRRAFAGGLLGLLALASPHAAEAQSAAEPADIVRRLYAPYLRNADARGPSAIDLIRPHAAPALARLIDREKACMRRTREICNIDADILIDGQDWRLSDLQVAAADAGSDRAAVRASFRNFDRPTTVDFAFVRRGGRWLIADVRPSSGASLAKLLAP